MEYIKEHKGILIFFAAMVLIVFGILYLVGYDNGSKGISAEGICTLKQITF